ncbi:MAG TPA: serine/threonine-protein kinase, partial [Actinomycetota bacterium]|nr:serine/threonine-protein kinase [Actinomycetota bacterium]
MLGVVVGRVIAGRYAVQVSLGRGGMGEVFLAQDQLLHRRVAVKEILSGRDSGLDPVAVERLIREARLAASIQHPNVVAVHDLIVEENQTFIVMEYLEARSLAEMIRTQTRLDPILVARIGAQVAGALEAAHRAGIVHRDVKPSNILIDTDSNAKLADFGVARGAGDTNLTSTGMVIGSVAFMSPEVAKGDPATPAADIFSLGCTLYAAVEGHAPFTDTSDPTNSMRILVRLISETAPPASHAGPISDLLARMLDPNPKGRPSAGETQRQLATTTITTGDDQTTPTTPATPTPITAPATSTPEPAQTAIDTAGPIAAATQLVTNRITTSEFKEPAPAIDLPVGATP